MVHFLSTRLPDLAAGVPLYSNYPPAEDAARVKVSLQIHSLLVAQDAARSIRSGSVFLDLNSASPGTKQAVANLSRPWSQPSLKSSSGSPTGYGM